MLSLVKKIYATGKVFILILGVLSCTTSGIASDSEAVVPDTVFYNVEKIQLRINVHEIGAPLGPVGMGQESDFWVGRSIFKKIADEELRKLLKKERLNIELTRGFQFEGESYKGSLVSCEHGYRLLNVGITVKKIENSKTNLQHDRFIATFSSSLVRKDYKDGRDMNGSVYELCETLSSPSQFPATMVEIHSNFDELSKEKIRQAFRDSFSGVIANISNAIQK